jgi:nucleotide-binding universal stress UspA family protein
MRYRTILVELTTEASLASNLPLATALSERFDAAFIGLHVVVPPFVPGPWEGGASVYVGPELIEAQRKAAQALRERVESRFREHGAARGQWQERTGDPAILLAEAAHTVDLVVAAKGGTDSVGTAAIAEHLVLAAGVPVLVLPPGASTAMGQSVLVGWNSSRESARAVHQALPFLLAAREVTLCAIGEDYGASLTAAAEMLRRHEVKVASAQVPGLDRRAGEVLLAEAAARGSDMVVMGAYGHHRLRELVFGGATRQVLADTTIPVLFGS